MQRIPDDSYRILHAHIMHALSLPGHPLRVTEKASHGKHVGLYSWHSQRGQVLNRSQLALFNFHFGL